MSFERKIDEYTSDAQQGAGNGRAGKLAKLASQRILNARQRIDYLFDPDSFLESGMFATSDSPMRATSTPADGKVCGYGRIDGS